MKLLIIEDEVELSNSMVTYLQNENYNCDTAFDFLEGIYKIDSFEYDCILLDISLPGGNGLQILQALQEDDKTDGVIIISARDSIDDKIAGLKLGADDYLPKPFHLSELSARIASVIRRKRFKGSNVLVANDITINVMAKTVEVNKVAIELTKTEFDLLLYLVSNKNRVISKNAIAENISEGNIDSFDSFDFVYSHMKNLKKKLSFAGAEDCIKSIYGMGYKFVMQ